MSYAKDIATDIIAQLAANPKLFAIPYTAAYRRQFVDATEKAAAPGTAASVLQLIFAPVDTDYERIGWGAARITVTLGMLVTIQVADPTNDAEIDPLEEFVDVFATWLLGARQFATVFSAQKPTVIAGDHLNDHLYEKSEFHVPIIAEFFCDVGVA